MIEFETLNSSRKEIDDGSYKFYNILTFTMKNEDKFLMINNNFINENSFYYYYDDIESTIDEFASKYKIGYDNLPFINPLTESFSPNEFHEWYDDVEVSSNYNFLKSYLKIESAQITVPYKKFNNQYSELESHYIEKTLDNINNLKIELKASTTGYQWSEIKKFYDIKLYINGIECSYREEQGKNTSTDEGVSLVIDKTRIDVSSFDYIYLNLINKIDYSIIKIDQNSGTRSHMNPFISYNKMIETNDDITINCRYDISIIGEFGTKNSRKDISKSGQLEFGGLRFSKSKITILPKSYDILTITNDANLNDDESLSYLISLNDIEKNDKHFVSELVDKENHIVNYNDSVGTKIVKLDRGDSITIIYRSVDEVLTEDVNSSINFNFVTAKHYYGIPDMNYYSITEDGYGISYQAIMNLTVIKNSKSEDDESDINLSEIYSVVDTADFEGIGSEISLFGLNQTINVLAVDKLHDEEKELFDVPLVLNRNYDDIFNIESVTCYIDYVLIDSVKHYIIESSLEEIAAKIDSLPEEFPDAEIVIPEGDHLIQAPNFVHLKNQYTTFSNWIGIISSYGIIINSMKLSNNKNRFRLFYKDFEGNDIDIIESNNETYIDGFNDSLADKLVIAPEAIVSIINNAKMWGKFIADNKFLYNFGLEFARNYEPEEINFLDAFYNYIINNTDFKGRYSDIVSASYSDLPYIFFASHDFIHHYLMNNETIKNETEPVEPETLKLSIIKSLKNYDIEKIIEELINRNGNISENKIGKIIDEIKLFKNLGEGYIYTSNIYIEKITSEMINDDIKLTLDITPSILNFEKENSINCGIDATDQRKYWIGTMANNARLDNSWFRTVPQELDENALENYKNEFSIYPVKTTRIDFNYNNVNYYMRLYESSLNRMVMIDTENVHDDNTTENKVVYQFLLGNNQNTKFQKEHFVSINQVIESDSYDEDYNSDTESKNNVKYLTECTITFPEVIDVTLKSYKDELTKEKYFYPLLNDTYGINISIREGTNLTVDDIHITMTSYDQPDVITPEYSDAVKNLNLILNPTIPYVKRRRVLNFVGEYTIDGEKTTFDFTTTLNVTEIVDESDDTTVKYMETVANPITNQIEKRQVIFITMKNTDDFNPDLEYYFNLSNEFFSEETKISSFHDNNLIGIRYNVDEYEMEDLKSLESGINFSYRTISDRLKELNERAFLNIRFDKMGVIAKTTYKDGSVTYDSVIISNFVDKGNTLNNLMTKLARPNGSMFYQVVLVDKVDGFDYRIFIDGKEYFEGDIIQNEQIEIATHKFRLYAFSGNDYKLIDSFVCGIDNTKPSVPLFKSLSTYQILSNVTDVKGMDYRLTKKSLMNILSNPLSNIYSEITDDNLPIFNLNKPLENMNKIIPEEFRELFGISVECLNIDSDGNPILLINEIKNDFVTVYNNNDYPIRVEMIPSNNDFLIDYEVNSAKSDKLDNDEYFNNDAIKYSIPAKGSIKFIISFRDGFVPDLNKEYSIKMRVQYILNSDKKWYEIIFKYDNGAITNLNSIFYYIKDLLPYRFYKKNGTGTYEVSEETAEITVTKLDERNNVVVVTEEREVNNYKWKNNFEPAEYFVLDRSVIDLTNFNTTYLYKLQMYLDGTLIYDSNVSSKLLIEDEENNQLNYMLDNGKHIITLMTHKFNGTSNFKNYVIILAPDNYYTGIEMDDDIEYSRNVLIPRHEINKDLQFEGELYMDSFANPSIVQKDKNGNLYLYKITEVILNKLMNSKFIIENENLIREKLKSSFREYSKYVNERYSTLVDDIKKHIEGTDNEEATMKTLIDSIENIETTILDRDIEKLDAYLTEKTTDQNGNKIDEENIEKNTDIELETDYSNFKDKTKYITDTIYIFKNLTTNDNICSRMAIQFSNTNDIYSFTSETALLALVNINPKLIVNGINQVILRDSNDADIGVYLTSRYDEENGILYINTAQLLELEDDNYSIYIPVQVNNTTISLIFKVIVEDIEGKITINDSSINNQTIISNYFKSLFDNAPINIYGKPSILKIENNTSLSINVKINNYNWDTGIIVPYDSYQIPFSELGDFFKFNINDIPVFFEGVANYLNSNGTNTEKLNRFMSQLQWRFSIDFNEVQTNKGKLLLYKLSNSNIETTFILNYFNTDGVCLSDILSDGKTDYSIMFNKNRSLYSGYGIVSIYNDTDSDYIGEISSDIMGFHKVETTQTVSKDYSRYYVICPPNNGYDYKISDLRNYSDWLVSNNDRDSMFEILKQRNNFVLPKGCLLILRVDAEYSPIGLSFKSFNITSIDDTNTLMHSLDPYNGMSIFYNNGADEPNTTFPMDWYEANSARYPIEPDFCIEVGYNDFDPISVDSESEIEEIIDKLNQLIYHGNNTFYSYINNILEIYDSISAENMNTIINDINSSIFIPSSESLNSLIDNIKNYLTNGTNTDNAFDTLSKASVFNKNLELQENIINSKASVAEYKNYIYSVNASLKKLVNDMNEILSYAYGFTNKGFTFYYEKTENDTTIKTNYNILSRGFLLDVGAVGYYEKSSESGTSEEFFDKNFIPGVKYQDLHISGTPYVTSEVIIDPGYSPEGITNPDRYQYLAKAVQELFTENRNYINEIISTNGYSLEGIIQPGSKSINDFIN